MKHSVYVLLLIALLSTPVYAQDRSVFNEKLMSALQKDNPKTVISAYKIPRNASIPLINNLVNKRIKYKREHLGKDVWQSPIESLNNGGDCEDFAIAKMAIIHEMHKDKKGKMRMHIVKTYYGEYHAFITVNNRRLDILKTEPFTLIYTFSPLI